jgi:hypothetical protein
VLRRLGLGALVAGPLLSAASLVAVTAPAEAATTVTSYSFVSEAGDYAGGGTSGTLSPPTSTFRLSGTAGLARVFVDGPGGFWTMGFGAPTGEQLTPGTYTDVQQVRSEGHAGLDVGNGSRCSDVHGSFTVDSIGADTTGELTELDLTFEQHCGSATAPALRGTLRYEAPPSAPVVLTSSNPSVVTDQPVTLTAGVRHGGGGTVTFLDGGTPIGSVAVADHLASLTTAALAVGTHDIVASYVGEHGGDDTSAPVTQQVADGDTSYWFRSTGGDYIGQGATASYVPSDSTSIVVDGDAAYLTFRVYTGDEWWDVSFAAPSGETLHPGTYTGAQRAPFRGDGHPGLDLGGDGRGCNQVAGDFVVHEIRSDPLGNVLSLDASFVQHCEWAIRPPLEGRVRYHVTSKTLLDAYPFPVPYGGEQQATFDVVVTALDVTPTGTVAMVAEDGATLCTVTLSDGAGHCALSPAQVVPGSYLVKARYEPDAASSAAGLEPSVSDGRVVWVQKAMTRVVASPVGPTGVVGSQRVTYRATLTSRVTGAPLAGEVVRFSPSTGSAAVAGSCTGVTDAAGVATCSAPLTAAVAVGASLGYTASFDETARYYPSSANGAITLT